MRWLLGSLAAGFVLAWLTPRCPGADGSYADLLRRLPDSTNVLVVADVDGLRKALGLKPGSAILQSGISSVPLGASTFVMGAQVNMSQRTHIWSIALCRHGGKIAIQDIGKLEGDQVEEIAGAKIVPCMRNAYFIELAPDVLAVGTPADRQKLKRWLAYQRDNQIAALSPYLQEAAKGIDDALAVMAADLTDSLDPSAIHRGLNGSKVLASRKKPNYEAVEKTLVRLKGVTLTLQPGEPFTGTLTAHFDTETNVIQPFAKALFLEILQHAGLHVRDFNEWKLRLTDRSVGLSGTLSMNGFRRFAALIQTPAPAPEAANMVAYNSLSPAEQAKTSSLRYFKSVTQILKDLKEDKTSYTKGQADWYDRYADQITKLPILGVDPELIQFASATSENLRAMGASLNGITIAGNWIDRQKVEGQIYTAPNYTGNYSGYNAYGGYWGGGAANLANNMALYRSGTAGGVTTVNNYNQVYQAQDNLLASGKAARVKLWERIDNETAAVRRNMTMKYQTEF
jgi:hypothetical protein